MEHYKCTSVPLLVAYLLKHKKHNNVDIHYLVKEVARLHSRGTSRTLAVNISEKTFLSIKPTIGDLKASILVYINKMQPNLY